MRRNSLDLTLVIGISLIGILIALFSHTSSGEIDSLPLWFAPIGILMTLYLPGYSLTVGLFPKADGTAVFTLSLGLSIAIDILGGLLLNLTPWGLQPASWAVMLGGIATVGSLINKYHRRKKSMVNLNIENISPPWKSRDVVLLSVAVAITVLSIGLTLRDLSSKQGFTQLWTIPSSENGSYALNIGIENQERQISHYRLYLEEGGVRLMDISDIAVASGKTWTTVLVLNEHPQDVINIYLYLMDNTKDPYRITKISPTSFNYIMTPTPTSP